MSPDSPIVLDTEMFGRPEATCAHLLTGPEPAVVDVGSAATAETLAAALDAAGVDSLASIVLTHIHFDHAGGAGHLARAFPEAQVYIPERVARHLADPSRLIEGVRAVWGPGTDRLFGLPLPIDPERITALDDGDTISLGDRRLRAIATPGHTRGHLVYLDEGTGSVICGDAIGVIVPGSDRIRATTPPADFSFTDAIASIERIREAGPASLHLPHFGDPAGDGRTEGTPATPAETLDLAAGTLRSWPEAFDRLHAGGSTREDMIAGLDRAALEGPERGAPPEVREHMSAVNPVWLNFDGLEMEAKRLEARGG